MPFRYGCLQSMMAGIFQKGYPSAPDVDMQPRALIAYGRARRRCRAAPWVDEVQGQAAEQYFHIGEVKVCDLINAVTQNRMKA